MVFDVVDRELVPWVQLMAAIGPEFANVHVSFDGEYRGYNGRVQSLR